MSKSRKGVMSRWCEVDKTGERMWSGKGASRRLKDAKRREAEHRNDATPDVRTAAYRRSQGDVIQTIASLGNLTEITPGIVFAAPHGDDV